MKNEVDEFLGGAEEVNDPFTPDVADPFQKEKPTEVIEEVKEEKPLPFHKDPKVLRFIEKEVEKRLPPVSETERFVADTKETTDDIDDVLTRIIGNDTPEKVSASKDLKKVLLGLSEKGAERAMQQLQAERDRELQEESEADEELAQGFEHIEETFNVDLTSNSPQARKARGEFIDFVRRVSPKDNDGEVVAFPDFEETYTLFQETKKTATPSRAKELASRSLERSSEATAPTGDKSWKAVDKLFSKLSDK